MKTTTVNFESFANEAMSTREMNFLKGGLMPEYDFTDLTIPPKK